MKAIKIVYCPTKHMIADQLTKPLAVALFRYFAGFLITTPSGGNPYIQSPQGSQFKAKLLGPHDWRLTLGQEATKSKQADQKTSATAALVELNWTWMDVNWEEVELQAGANTPGLGSELRSIDSSVPQTAAQQEMQDFFSPLREESRFLAGQ